MQDAADFAKVFRAHIIPRIKPEITRAGVRIAAGETQWGDAFDALLAFAGSRGAYHLAKPNFNDFYAGLERALIASVDAADADAAEIRADPVGHYTALAASCKDPERMEWVFASINPAYRAHLKAQYAR